MLEDVHAVPLDRLVQGHTFQEHFEVAYRLGPSCQQRLVASDVGLDDEASRPYEEPDDEDEARVHRPAYEDGARAAIRSSCHEVA